MHKDSTNHENGNDANGECLPSAAMNHHHACEPSSGSGKYKL